MSANPDSVVNQGEFHSSRGPARNHPMAPGHDITKKVGNDAYPEFHAQTAPPGTAPPDRTFRPNTQGTIPGQALNPDLDDSYRTGALDMPGSTSKDIHNANPLGKPIQGQTSQELHDNSTERAGLEGVGASDKWRGVEGKVRQHGYDLPGDLRRGIRDTDKIEKGEGGYDAQERIPASANEVASERP
ncbi:hypothetical protein V8F20_004375 [Naviculisporaceae sp. PSN 640]